MSTPNEEAAKFWDRQVENPDEEVRHWFHVPEVLHAVNRRVTGEGGAFPLAGFFHQLHQRRAGAAPAERALSIGCGSGNLEREVVRADAARFVDGIDISEGSLARARELAGEEGFADRLSYHLADAVTFLRGVPDGHYSLIFFHGSLHHITELEETLEECARVLRGTDPGLLYVDEYIGPSQQRWTDAVLAPARRLFATLPEKYRRAPVLYPPIAPDDPSEMVRADEIESVLRAFFRVQLFRPYGGNILFPLISSIRGTCFDEPEVKRVIRQALDEEEELVAGGTVRPLFAVFVARPLSVEEAKERGDALEWIRKTRNADPDILAHAREVEATLARQVRELHGMHGDLQAEVTRLDGLIAEMRSTRAWRLHEWLERHVRRRLRRR
ncbi:MAG: class I SAM-dependent methyltransferase [Acidobacteriota bacterium]